MLLASKDNLSKSLFLNRLYQLNRGYSYEGFRQGMKDGGVVVDKVTDPDDVKAIEKHIKQHRAYARSFVDQLYDGNFTDKQLGRKPDAWFDGTIYPMYIAGLRSASGNMMMQWVMNVAKENCKTCKALNGQIHRLRDYVKAGWVPKSRKLACGGHFCGCQFVPAFGASARGRFPKAA